MHDAASFPFLQLPEQQFIGWHIWNNEKQIQRMDELSTEFVSTCG